MASWPDESLLHDCQTDLRRLVTFVSIGSHSALLSNRILLRHSPGARMRLLQISLFALLFPSIAAGQAPTIGGCPSFPANSIWNAAIDTLPLHANSATYIASISANTGLRYDVSMPVNFVSGTQPKVPIILDDPSESDPGPYPIPPNAQVEGGSDLHVLVVDKDNCILYETFLAVLQADGSWTVGSSAKWSLTSNDLRPAGWTSADAAGLPITPGLLRYDEMVSGQINHALRFTAPRTQRLFVWPARHFASSSTSASLPPMGQRFRLKASFDISGFSPNMQTILRALKKYGLILADNGLPWFLQGNTDSRWNGSELDTLRAVLGSNLEAVDVSGLMIAPDSGQAAQPGVVSVTVSPGSANLTASHSQQFTATVSGSSLGVTWSMNPVLGTLTPTGLYTAPASVSVAQNVTVTATLADGSKSGSATVTLQPGLLPALSSILISPLSVTGGNSVNVTVNLTAFAPASGAAISIAGSNPAFPNASVTVNAGLSFQTFALPTSVVTAVTPVILTATYGGASVNSLPLIINPNSGTAATNLALGKTATQSSTLAGYASAAAGAALDGNTGGIFFSGSVTHTNQDANAWWQVDLSTSATINSLVIWNRTDCCGKRLNDYWIFVSDIPFATSDTPSTLQTRAGTWGSHQTTGPSPFAVIAAGAGVHGRYVRVQLSTTGYLSLAEVEVIGSAPTGSNLALGKTASQSSTLPGFATTGPGAAVDGNTDGVFFNGSVTHTNLDVNAWWQVDLGTSASINSITIWNRTDCCSVRLNDYWVFVSDTPFDPADTPSMLASRAATWDSHQTLPPSPSFTISGAQGRYVRVQLNGAGYLSLAEVQVFGTSSASGLNLAAGKSASQSSTLPGFASAGAGSAVDGNTGGNFFSGSITHTNLESTPWWQVDLGASTTIASIVVWNRMDCCSARLNDYWVFVSDTPFSAADTPAMLQNRAGTFASHQSSAPLPSAAVPIGATGRYVRVQLAGTNYLSLAEVQVIAQ